MQISCVAFAQMLDVFLFGCLDQQINAYNQNYMHQSVDGHLAVAPHYKPSSIGGPTPQFEKHGSGVMQHVTNFIGSRTAFINMT